MFFLNRKFNFEKSRGKFEWHECLTQRWISPLSTKQNLWMALALFWINKVRMNFEWNFSSSAASNNSATFNLFSIFCFQTTALKRKIEKREQNMQTHLCNNIIQKLQTTEKRHRVCYFNRIKKTDELSSFVPFYCVVQRESE